MVRILAKRADCKKRYQLIGVGHLRKQINYFTLHIPRRVLRRAETCEYRLMLSKKFQQVHYMEEIVIRSGKCKQSVLITEQLEFIWKD